MIGGNTYEGALLSDRFPKGRKSGSIRIDASQMRFYSDDECLDQIPLKQLDITRGGTGNRFLYFKDKNRSGITFYTDDLKILDADELKWMKETAGVSGKIKRNIFSNYLFIGLVILGILGGLAFLIMKSDRLIERVASLFPTSLEAQMSETMKTSALEGKTILKDSILDAQIARITSILLNQIDTTGYSFSFTVIQQDEINAFALPGGPIIIHSGLLEKADNPEEIAGVLAHEISHVTRRHHLRGIIGNMGIYFIFRGLVGDVTGISTQVINAGATLGSLKYSRNYEQESDESGMAMLQKAHIKTDGMITFFEKLGSEHPIPKSADFISTHPNPKNRIKYLQKIKGENENTIDLRVDLDLIKKRIQTLKNKDGN
jgi:Zn-dependent protease with chaperone function